MAKNQRASKMEIMRRISRARMSLLSGIPSERLVQIMSTEYEVTTRQARRYVRWAREEIQEILEQTATEHLAEHIALRRDVRFRAYQKDDFRMALESAKDEAKLLGLYPANRTEITGADGGDVRITSAKALTDEELAAAIAVELASRGGESEESED